MKRVIICLLILMLTLPVAAAHAEGNPMQSMRLKCEVDGDVLDAYFYAEIAYASETAAFESMDFVLTYAQDVLELIELVKTGEVAESDIIDSSFMCFESTDTAGRFEYHCASALGHRGSGLLLHLRFRILGEGGYRFRVARDGYSIYDSASKKSESYRFALLREDQPADAGTPLPEIEKPEAQPSDEPKEEGWFMKLIHSIFGSSCRCG